MQVGNGVLDDHDVRAVLAIEADGATVVPGHPAGQLLAVAQSDRERRATLDEPLVEEGLGMCRVGILVLAMGIASSVREER